MDVESIMLSEISQTEKVKYHRISPIGGLQKTKQMNKKTKLKQTHKHREQSGCHRGRVGGMGEIGEGGEKMNACYLYLGDGYIRVHISSCTLTFVQFIVCTSKKTLAVWPESCDAQEEVSWLL